MNFDASFRILSRWSRTATNGGRNRRAGWALVSVLWTLAILAILAAGVRAMTVASARFEHRELAQIRLAADIQAGLARAALGISDPRPEKRWRVDGVAERFVYRGDTMTISVRDETAKVDLNMAGSDTLEKVFEAAGLSHDDATALAGNIVDWRTPVSDDMAERAKQNAVDDAYVKAGRAFVPRHGPFETVSEVNLVLGMTPRLYSEIAPSLTVYSRKNVVNFSYASEGLKRALEADDENEQDGAMPPSGDDAAAGGDADQYPGTLPDVDGLGGHSFEIAIRADHGSDWLARDIVVEFTGDPARQYLVEAWRKGP